MKFNKILLVVASFLASAISSLGQNNIGTLVTDPIRPFSVSSTHPSAIANEIKGGPFTSSNLAGLSNIPAPRLEVGAIGYATNTGLYYRLTTTNPAIWSSIDGSNITNLNASNITGSIPFLNISNALTNASVAFGTATFNGTVQGAIGVATNPAFRFGTNQSGFYYGSQLGFGQSVAVSIFGSNIARFQSNRVVFDQPIDFLSPTSVSALTTRTNLGIQDFVTNPVVQVVSGGTGATNAGGARTNLGLGATNDVAFQNLFLDSGQLSISNSGIYWLGTVRYEPETQTFQGTIQIENGAVAIVGTNAAANIATTRTNLGLGATWLTNMNVTNFRTAIGLGSAGSVSFEEVFVSNALELANGAPNGITIDADGIQFGATNAAVTRTNLGLSWSGLTNTNATTFRSALEIGLTNTLTIAGIVSQNVTITAGGGITLQSTLTNAASFRTNIGLGWSALTNTNAGTSLVSVNTNGDVVSPTNFWQRAPIQTTVQDFTGITVSQTNNATNARNVYVYSLATNVSGISNTIILPTNTLTFNGDEVTVVHKGTTNTTTVVRQAGATNNLITLNKFDESVKFVRELGQWDFYHNISFVEPIQFSGTNTPANVAASRTNLGLGAEDVPTFNGLNIGSDIDVTLAGIIGYGAEINLEERDLKGGGVNFDWNLGESGFFNVGAIVFANTTNAATTRTNLGLPLAALTNTSNTTFQQAIFTTNAAPTNAVNFGDHVAWMGVSIVTNGVTNVFRIPLYK